MLSFLLLLCLSFSLLLPLRVLLLWSLFLQFSQLDLFFHLLRLEWENILPFLCLLLLLFLVSFYPPLLLLLWHLLLLVASLVLLPDLRLHLLQARLLLEGLCIPFYLMTFLKSSTSSLQLLMASSMPCCSMLMTLLHCSRATLHSSPNMEIHRLAPSRAHPSCFVWGPLVTWKRSFMLPLLSPGHSAHIDVVTGSELLRSSCSSLFHSL